VLLLLLADKGEVAAAAPTPKGDFFHERLYCLDKPLRRRAFPSDTTTSAGGGGGGCKKLKLLLLLLLLLAPPCVGTRLCPLHHRRDATPHGWKHERSSRWVSGTLDLIGHHHRDVR